MTSIYPLRALILPGALLAASGCPLQGDLGNYTATDQATGPGSGPDPTATATATGGGSPTTGTTGGSTGMTTAPETTTGTTTTTTTTTNTTGSDTTNTGSDTTTANTTAPVDTTTDTSSTGDGEPVCVQLMQAFTDPPVPSGWEQCGDKLTHRVEAVTCVVPATPDQCDPNAEFKNCTTNADCVAKPFGSCHFFDDQPIGLPACECVYGCETDADCPAGRVCRCAGDVLGPVTTCVESKCTDDSECGDELCQFGNASGVGCKPPWVDRGGCTSPEDQCDSETQCDPNLCAFGEGFDVWYCGAGSACGRPLLVDGRAITAPAVASDDWRTLLAVPSAPPALRERLAAHWTAIALAEHASIASFARFVLQLLAVAAPPELVRAAQQALADEVEHARLAFGLASLYAGHGVGPGALSHAGGGEAFDLDAIVSAVIREACVGETLSALEIREAAARAEEPALRRALQKIADDELRHAQLGWRFVQWALASADAAQRARAQAVFTAAIAGAEAAAEAFCCDRGEPELRPHGIVDPPLRAAVWREGLAVLVRPSAATLRDAA